MQGQTAYFTAQKDSDRISREKLTAVYDALNEKGYDAVNQIVGYLFTEDPTYITSNRNARAIMSSMDRDDILELLVRNFMKDRS